MEPVLINGTWRAARASGTFQSFNPNTRQALPGDFPISTWEDLDAALHAAALAARQLRQMSPDLIAQFLEGYAGAIEAHASELVEIAHAETGLPKTPRLAEVELVRTTNQLRQAAAAARTGSWALPTLDTKINLRSCHGPLGPVAVFGPNNFPFAFNSVAGGDFAAAVAAGNPVIGKANTSHPATTKRFAELAKAAVDAAGLPPATVQLVYRTSHADGNRLVADHRLGATGYTGSRQAGLQLKAAAEQAGKPIYLELSSINPVVLLPGALRERSEAIVADFCTSCLAASGQMCTNPGLVLLHAGAEATAFIKAVQDKFAAAPLQTLLSERVGSSLAEGVQVLRSAGAELLTGGSMAATGHVAFQNTLFTVSGSRFLADSERLQTELFGNATLMVQVKDQAELLAVLEKLEGNLTGSIYSAQDGSDDAAYGQVSDELRGRVGRLLNDKMPTGVAVSAAMNHGGPYPATGHPGFTAVGFPAALRRFSMLQAFDNVREHRLPALLQNANPRGAWRLVDGVWTQAPLS